MRPIFSNRGDFRGYCSWSSERAAALQALQLDRQSVEGRPLFVSLCGQSKNPDFKVGMRVNPPFHRLQWDRLNALCLLSLESKWNVCSGEMPELAGSIPELVR